MKLESLDIAIYPFLGAVVVVTILGLGVAPFLKAKTDLLMSDHADSPLFQNPYAGKPGWWIGTLERILFTLAIVIGYPVAIGGWLVFKVAAKWEAWGHIVRLPDSKDSSEGTDETAVRLRFASWVHSRFIIGTLLNILIAAIGAWSYLKFDHLLRLITG